MKIKLVTAVLFLSVLCGCVSSQGIVTGQTHAAIPWNTVRIYQKMPAAGREVAQLTVKSAGDGQTAMNTAIRQLAKDAARLGANGLVIVGSGTRSHTDGGMAYYNRSSGLILSDDTTTHETVVKARAIYVEKH